MEFDNNCSQQRFIGNRNLEQVIAQDGAELVSIGGSFDAIASRMQEFIDFAKAKDGIILGWDDFQEHMKPVFDKYQALYGDNIPKGKPWQDYSRDWAIRMAQHPATWLDDLVAVINYIGTRGWQECPYGGCEDEISTFDVSVLSRKNKRALTVNPLTVHMARDHQLLEKDNEYGISVKEFYEAFM